MPALPCLAYEAYLHFRNKERSESKKVAVVLFTAILVTLMIVGAYFINYKHPWWNPPSPGLAATLKTSAMFMSMSFGPGVALSWLLSSAIILILVFATTCLLLYALSKLQGGEFRRAFGLFLFMGGSIVFALAMGWGRA